MRVSYEGKKCLYRSVGVLECIETEYKHSLPEHSPLTDNKINMTHHTNITNQRGPCMYQPTSGTGSRQAQLHCKVGLLVFLSSEGKICVSMIYKI